MLLLALFLLIIRLAEAQASPPQAHEYIRVVQENGVWWFRDDSGHNFFSLGVNCVGGCYGHAEKTALIPARKTWIISLLQAARAPFMIGMHWFMWMDYAQQDQAMGGYLPDKNMGLVSNDETVVYEEFGQWVKRTNALVDATHRSAHWTAPPAQQLQRRALQRVVPTVDGHVAEWPSELAIKPTMVNALSDHARADHTYFISWDTQYLYLAGDISDSHLEPPHPNSAWEEGDYLSVRLSPMGPPATGLDAPTAIFIFPIGGGADRQQPYAARWSAAEGYRQLPLRVRKRLRPGGYTIEARIPVRSMAGFKGIPGAAWNMKLTYQNVNEIYRTHWEGVVTLRP